MSNISETPGEKTIALEEGWKPVDVVSEIAARDATAAIVPESAVAKAPDVEAPAPVVIASPVVAVAAVQAPPVVAPEVKPVAQQPVEPKVEATAPRLVAVRAGAGKAAPATPPAPVGETKIEKPAPHSKARGYVERYGFIAAGALVAIGCGWIIGANTFESGASRQMVAAVKALDAKIDAVAAANVARGDLDALRADMKKFATGLDATRNNTGSAVAQLTAKFDRSEREHLARQERFEKEIAARLDKLGERLDRVERAAASATPTASIPVVQAPAPTPPVTAAVAPARAPETRVPQATEQRPPERARVPANGYVLREVRDGAALVEGRAGLREVLPGDILPGAGRVRSIERRGRQWVVVTTNGVIDAQGY